MFGEFVSNIFRLAILILLQALVLDNWTLDIGIQPYLYILFILALPFETPPWAVLILGFVAGITMDAFENTEGMHASALTLMAYIRRPLLAQLAPRDGYESGTKPRIKDMGFTWYFRYAAILTLIHHVWLIGLDHFRIDETHIILFKGILSGIFTLVLIILYQYLIHGSPRRGRR